VLAQGKLQLLAPHGWLKPKQKYITLQDLAGQSMIGLEGQDPLSRLLDAKLQALRPLPVVQTRVQTHQMMRSMVEAGEGLAIVDPFTASGAREAGLDACPAGAADDGQPVCADAQGRRRFPGTECVAGNRHAESRRTDVGTRACGSDRLEFGLE
jgi:DNA-binding transcriptional LysR family regulator